MRRLSGLFWNARQGRLRAGWRLLLFLVVVAAFGPEGGLLGTAAIALGFVLVIAWLRLRPHGLRLHLSLADPPAAQS